MSAESESATAELEAQLTGFCAEVLGTDQITPDDFLLDLGGNSLVATMVANRIELAWGVRPTLEEMLTTSVQEIARACEQRLDGTPS